MLRRWILFLLLSFSWICHAVDYDVVVVGTSPASLFEALYQHYTGKRVLILEKDSQCGGAWKSITICGVPHVDMGCHFMGSDHLLHDFLIEYAGCKMISLDNPDVPFEIHHSPNGFYPSRGCFELIDNLERLVRLAKIPLQLNCKMENVFIDAESKCAWVRTPLGAFSASKVIITPYSLVNVDRGDQGALVANPNAKNTFYHLYLLIEDSNPSTFCYRNTSINGSSRIMNLSRFTGIEGTGKQLIVFQIYTHPDVSLAESFLEQMKQQNMVSPFARLIQADFYNYEQSYFANHILQQVEYANSIFEILSTGSFSSMANYVYKWKQALPTYHNAISEGNL